LIIPKAIREAMKLHKRTLFRIQITEGKLILEPDRQVVGGEGSSPAVFGGV
jgi:bifunctional DNA-binding transcriptional regulator/antitoxin component of YhaV-PrlF toxin-antitoxin module